MSEPIANPHVELNNAREQGRLDALPPVSLPEVFKFIHEHFSNVAPKRASRGNPEHVEAAERNEQATLSEDEQDVAYIRDAKKDAQFRPLREVLLGIGASAELAPSDTHSGEAQSKPKPIPYGDIAMTVTRNREEIPVQVLITNQGVTEAWVCEDKGGFKNGESIILTLEEEREAIARYYGREE